MVAEKYIWTDNTGKEHPMIRLKQKETDTKGFCFGPTKARLILDHVNEIQQYDTECKAEAEAKK